MEGECFVTKCGDSVKMIKEMVLDVTRWLNFRNGEAAWLCGWVGNLIERFF